MQLEFNDLVKNPTLTLVPKPKCHKPITCKWMDRVKLKCDSILDKYNSHVVVKGYKKKYGIDYLETFTHMV